MAATDIDVVVICTPPGGRAEVATEALEAGKHLIIEKPAEVSLTKIDDIIAAQQKAGTHVTVISQHRFDPSTEVALAAIHNGGLGRLTSGIASIDWWREQSYYDSGGWRGTSRLEGGGALMNQGVHTVDLLVAMLGKPVEVFAYTATLAHKRIETEDVAVGAVKFESGALGVLHATTAAFPGLSARLQVHGDKGSIVIDNDELSFIHVTPTHVAREEKFFGSKGDAINRSPSTHYPVEPRPLVVLPASSPTPTATNTRTSWQLCVEIRRSEWAWPRTASPSASSLPPTSLRVPANPSGSPSTRAERRQV
jgi:predicted dehydrogenase